MSQPESTPPSTDPSTPPSTRSERKHRDLLWAAARLFAGQGVGHTTTREIAAAAATTERTLFKHFGSKEGLVRAVIAEAVLPHLAPVSLAALRTAIQRDPGDLVAWHTHLLQSRRTALEGQPELTRLLLMELLRDEHLRADFEAQWRTAVWQPLVDLFAGLQRNGAVQAAYPPDTLARLFLSVNLGYLLCRLVLAPQADWHDGRDIDDIARFFAAGARPQADPPVA